MDEMTEFHFEEEAGLQPWEMLRATETLDGLTRAIKVTLEPHDPEAQKACRNCRIEAYRDTVKQAKDIERQKRLAAYGTR